MCICLQIRHKINQYKQISQFPELLSGQLPTRFLRHLLCSIAHQLFVERLMGGEEEESRISPGRVVVSLGELAVPAICVVANELEVGFCAEGWCSGVWIEDTEALSAVEADSGADCVVSGCVKRRLWEEMYRSTHQAQVSR